VDDSVTTDTKSQSHKVAPVIELWYQPGPGGERLWSRKLRVARWRDSERERERLYYYCSSPARETPSRRDSERERERLYLGRRPQHGLRLTTRCPASPPNGGVASYMADPTLQKSQERNQENKRMHPVLQYRVPHGSQHSPSAPRAPPSFTQSPFPPPSLLRDGQTSPHRPRRFVVSRSTCPPLSSPLIL
jgi:hypothetical protein